MAMRLDVLIQRAAMTHSTRGQIASSIDKQPGFLRQFVTAMIKRGEIVEQDGRLAPGPRAWEAATVAALKSASKPISAKAVAARLTSDRLKRLYYSAISDCLDLLVSEHYLQTAGTREGALLYERAPAEMRGQKERGRYTADRHLLPEPQWLQARPEPELGHGHLTTYIDSRLGDRP